MESSCGRADSVMDSHTTVGTVLYTELATDYHHIVERSLVCVQCLGRISRSELPKTLKWVTACPSVTFHING